MLPVLEEDGNRNRLGTLTDHNWCSTSIIGQHESDRGDPMTTIIATSASEGNINKKSYKQRNMLLTSVVTKPFWRTPGRYDPILKDGEDRPIDIESKKNTTDSLDIPRGMVDRKSNMNSARVRIVENKDDNNSDDVFLSEGQMNGAIPLTRTSRQRNAFQRQRYSETLRDNFYIMMSGMYGVLIVVLGSVLPIAESFKQDRPNAFQSFYIFLYLVSIAFLAYVYIFLLHHGGRKFSHWTKSVSSSGSFFRNKNRSESSSRMSECSSVASRGKQRNVYFDDSPNHHTGSFYLRLGAVGFGIGSMIHSGLYFGRFFDINSIPKQCREPIMTLMKQILKPLFTFSQLYFIFQNSKMCVYKFKIVARFGLMHMCAANLCVWIRSIVVETLHVLKEFEERDRQAILAELVTDSTALIANNTTTVVIASNITVSSLPLERNTSQYYWIIRNLTGGVNERVSSKSLIVKSVCQWSDMMTVLTETAAPYLYPFTIEYSLICAGVLYVMWRNVGKRLKRNESVSGFDDDLDDDAKRSHRISIDCAGSSRGLFLGILMFVAAVVLLVAFYVVINKNDMEMHASLLGHLTEIFIYLFAGFAAVMAAIRMRHLRFNFKKKDKLEETLILISLCGLYIFCVFSIIAALFHANSLDGSLTIVTNIFMVAQATLQSVFMITALRLSANKASHQKKKPGRQYVTFLLLCNFAMWAINTFETQRPEHNPLQLRYYGPKAWAIFTHTSVPLAIFYRFHSSVCLSHVWKNAWKLR